MTSENKQENGLIAKWGNELFDDGITNAPQCFMRYGRRFMKSTHFQLVCCIISYQYGSDAPFPSRDTIADNMGISVKRVGTLLQEIEEEGNVDIYWRYVNGKRSSSEYNFKPLIEKCLSYSKGITAEKNKNTKVFKKKKALKEQSVPSGLEQSVPLEKEQSIPLGLEQSVPSKKGTKERNVKKGIEPSVCSEEAEIIFLLESRSDINQTTHTALINILNKVKTKEAFKYSIFVDTLNLVDFDLYDLNYFKRALSNNLKKGYVRQATENKTTGTKHKEYIPTHMQQQMEELFDLKQKEEEEKQKAFEALPDEEKQSIQEKKQREIDDMLKKLRGNK